MKNQHLLPIFVLLTFLGLGLSSCAESDIVATYAKSSFTALVDKLGPSSTSYLEAEGTASLRSPLGDIFTMKPNPREPRFYLSFAAEPFLSAGLDPSKLSSSPELSYQILEDQLVYSFTWPASTAKSTTSSTETASGIQKVFNQIVQDHRDRIGYHEKLDHYGIALGGGNMVEWAKDLGTNSKDLVFILAPEPLVAAGLDPAKLAGWVFAPVEVKDASGKAIQVEKLLRPFEL